MKNFIEYVASSVLTTADSFDVVEQKNDKEYRLELHVSPDEIGKIIGKHGQMSHVLRTIARFHADKVLKKKLTFRIIEKN